jgi:hypothetical protein
MTNIILLVLAAAAADLSAEELAGAQQNAVIACMERFAKSWLVGAQHTRGSATALRRGFRLELYFIPAGLWGAKLVDENVAIRHRMF